MQRLAEFIAGAQRGQHVVGKQDGIVRALLFQALVQQLRQRDGGQVQRVSRDAGPPGGAQGPVVLPFVGRLLVPVFAFGLRGEARALGFAQDVHQLGAAVMLDVVLQDGRVVVDVDIGIDHRVIQIRLDSGGAGCLGTVQPVIHGGLRK
ncbi:hypothetical protein D3C71_1519090 [compost metagenome]